ncbi:MAG: hypothetical protein V2A66_04985 [Pseudomonadota bacterium]
MKILRLVSVISAVVVLAACGKLGTSSVSDSGSNVSGNSAVAHQYLKIPNAVFVPGSPPGSKGNTTQKPKVTAPPNTAYTLNQTVTWTVTFTSITEITVTDIIIEVPDLDGYFVYPLTPDELAAGEVAIETEVVDSKPGGQVCNRDWRGNGTCYGEADTGVTGMDFTAASYDDAQATFSWTVEVEATVTIESVDSSASDTGGTTGGSAGGSGGTCSSTYMVCTACSIQSCCNDSGSCWYVYNGQTYSTSAADQIAQSCVHVCTGY